MDRVEEKSIRSRGKAKMQPHAHEKFVHLAFRSSTAPLQIYRACERHEFVQDGLVGSMKKERPRSDELIDSTFHIWPKDWQKRVPRTRSRFEWRRLADTNH